jgi:hypothetical protein
MKSLNFSNVEELVFMDKNIQDILPPAMRVHFEQWKLAKRVPLLAQMGKHAILDFINGLEDDHILILEEYFGERIFVERLGYSLSMNYKIPISDANEMCQYLCKIEGSYYFSTWRDDEYLYATFWR